MIILKDNLQETEESIIDKFKGIDIHLKSAQVIIPTDNGKAKIYFYGENKKFINVNFEFSKETDTVIKRILIAKEEGSQNDGEKELYQKLKNATSQIEWETIEV